MTDTHPPPFKNVTLSDQVYAHLLRLISTGVYAPGQPLRELELVNNLGVSRTPIREALLRLAEYGLLEGSSRGYQVRRLGADEVVHVYQVRRALEREAIKRACGRLTATDFARLDALAPNAADRDSPEFKTACYQLDMELHRLIAVRSGNPILAKKICKLHDLVQLIHKPVADRRGRLDRELEQHLLIICALKAGDRPAATRALLTHLRSACRTWVRCVRADTARRPDSPALPTS
jgi:DNA-binding GntR family transcriptional regulator